MGESSGCVLFCSSDQYAASSSMVSVYPSPFRSTTSFRFETLTDDPEVKKAVDDILLDFAGEDNSRRPCNYHLKRVPGWTSF